MLRKTEEVNHLFRKFLNRSFLFRKRIRLRSRTSDKVSFSRNVQNVIETTHDSYPLHTGNPRGTHPMGISVSVDIWSARASPRQKKRYRNGDRSWECRRAIYQGLNCPVAASMSYQRGSAHPVWPTGWLAGWSVGRSARWLVRVWHCVQQGCWH